MTVPRRLGVIALLASLASLAACGSDGGGSGDDAPAAPNSSAAADPERPADTNPPDTVSLDTPPGDTRPHDTAPADEASGVEPEGFTTVRATITAADGEECEVCLWLADSADERGRGLMGVTDLGEAVGMAFVFEQPTNGAFYMFQTPTPLSIAWFASNGAWVGSADMEPCIDTPAAQCELYSPGADYDLAVETFAGGLGELVLTEGATVTLIEGSEAPECPLAESLSDP